MIDERGTVIRVRLRSPILAAIHWTADNTSEVYRFIERHGWTTRYTSGCHDIPMTYLHPRHGHGHLEVSARQGDWIVQDTADQDGIVVISDESFERQYIKETAA